MCFVKYQEEQFLDLGYTTRSAAELESDFSVQSLK